MAIEECLALGCEGVQAGSWRIARPIVAVPWVCVSHGLGLITLVPRTCAVRQELEAWGQQQPVLPSLSGEAGTDEGRGARRWHGHSVLRRVEVEYNAGRVAQEELRFVGAFEPTGAAASAGLYRRASKGSRSRHSARRAVQARVFACEADAEAAIAEQARVEARRRGALRAHGGIMRSAIIAWQRRAVRAAPVEAVQRRRTHPQLSQGIASWSR